jgi:hypothetical protein
MPLGYPTRDFPSICPFCNQEHEAATLVVGTVPVPHDGDVSLCFKCGTFCIFDSAVYGGLRKPTKSEHRTITHDEELQELWRSWKITQSQ